MFAYALRSLVLLTWGLCLYCLSRFGRIVDASLLLLIPPRLPAFLPSFLPCSFLVSLGTKLNVNIMSYDYSGYGMSSGKPLEKNLYADVECALHQLRSRYNARLEEIVLYGQSIGTAPTVDCASRYEVGGVVLHSPLMSGMRVACPGTRRTYCIDAFPK